MGIEEVLERHTAEWMALPGVVGTALGERDGEPCLKVYVVRKGPALEARIPKTVEGFAVVLQETGAIGALPKPRRPA
jgi:hypothetical protein